MSNHIQPNNNGGIPTHLNDCYVWIEILYLDSPTDYREHLPGRGLTGNSLGNNLELLSDGNARSPHPTKGDHLWPVILGAFVLALLIVLLVSYLTWL